MTIDEAIEILVEHATGKLPHANSGLCPDDIEGHDARDKQCIVCKAIGRLGGG